ncbi:hypothetical protein [Burkholderia gladioli]|uniref:hypothetical protein n=1 Tax=Burkholderia gladioli TaxID=28095 RepID=UPI0012D2D6E4|nr:hypothetical protein [Burkholderia gladioli]
MDGFEHKTPNNFTKQHFTKTPRVPGDAAIHPEQDPIAISRAEQASPRDFPPFIPPLPLDCESNFRSRHSDSFKR